MASAKVLLAFPKEPCGHCLQRVHMGNRNYSDIQMELVSEFTLTQ